MVDSLARERRIDLDRHTLAGEVGDDIEGPESPAGGQAVGHKVRRPAFVGSLGQDSWLPGEPSAAVAARVLEAREIQRQRHAGASTIRVNAVMPDNVLRRQCRLEVDGQDLLDTAFERRGLSARALTRILKVSRTIADLAASGRIGAAHVAEAIQYRNLDRRV